MTCTFFFTAVLSIPACSPLTVGSRLYAIPPPAGSYKVAHVTGLDRRAFVRADHSATDWGDCGSLTVEIRETTAIYDHGVVGGGAVLDHAGVDGGDCGHCCQESGESMVFAAAAALGCISA